MPTLRFVCTVTSKSATSVGLTLQGSTVDLVRNGDTWTGTSAPLVVADSLAGSFFAKGFQGTAWSLEIDIQCPDSAKKIGTYSGVIPAKGVSSLTPKATIPKDPCAPPAP